MSFSFLFLGVQRNYIFPDSVLILYLYSRQKIVKFTSLDILVEFSIGCLHLCPCSTSVYWALLYIINRVAIYILYKAKVHTCTFIYDVNPLIKDYNT